MVSHSGRQAGAETADRRVGDDTVSYSQRKTFLALYNEFCPSDPVKLANDRSAASRASNELDSYFEVGVEYCLIGHEVHISGEAARSTKGPKEHSISTVLVPRKSDRDHINTVLQLCHHASTECDIRLNKAY